MMPGMGKPGGSGGSGGVSPDGVEDATEFVARMVRLKERSGLTYRQLEERAAERGEVLARSTLADVLRRSSLPRPEVVAAFVRACGYADEVPVWLAARERVAAAPEPPGPAVPTAPAAPPGSEPAGPPERPGTDPGSEAAPALPATGAESGVPPVRPGGRHPGSRRVLLVSLPVLALIFLGAWILLPETPGDAASRAPAEGWSRIRPAGSPALCVTEGRDRKGRYQSAVAVQRNCSGATPPHTYLERVGDGLNYIQWHHPKNGKGCLTVLTAENHAVRNLLEPWPTCEPDRTTQQFRFEPVDTPVAGGYRVRVANSGLCLGILGGDTRSGAEITQERCTGGADQEFLVDAVG